MTLFACQCPDCDHYTLVSDLFDRTAVWSAPGWREVEDPEQSGLVQRPENDQGERVMEVG